MLIDWNNKEERRAYDRKYREGRKNIINEQRRECSRKLREELIDHLGGKCVLCESTNDLEINHKNLADTSKRRNSTYRSKYKISSLYQLQKFGDDVELLCKDCHKKWSMAQRSAAYNLLSSLPLEEQIRLTNDEFYK